MLHAIVFVEFQMLGVIDVIDWNHKPDKGANCPKLNDCNPLKNNPDIVQTLAT